MSSEPGSALRADLESVEIKGMLRESRSGPRSEPGSSLKSDLWSAADRSYRSLTNGQDVSPVQSQVFSEMVGRAQPGFETRHGGIRQPLRSRPAIHSQPASG